MSALGAFALFIMLSGSLSLSEREKSKRSQHDISKLDTGSYQIDYFKNNKEMEQKVLIIKDWSNKIYVHILPLENNVVVMPERWWGWGYFHCNDFSPEVIENNKIRKHGKIKCHDKNAPEWLKESEWVWEYSGKSLGQRTHDMISRSYEINHNTLYVNG